MSNQRVFLLFLCFLSLVGIGIIYQNVVQQKESTTVINNKSISPSKAKLVPTVEAIKDNSSDLGKSNGTFDLQIGDDLLQIVVPDVTQYGLDYTLPETGKQMFDELAARAKEDPIAARVLAQQLQICEETPRTKNDLNKEIEVIRKDSELAGVAGQAQTYIFESREEAAAFELQLVGDFKLCKTVTNEMISRKIEFFEIASNQGDFIATLTLNNIGVSNSDWERVFSSAWDLWNEHGSPMSLGSLAPIYKDNLVSNIALAGISNQVTAHALNLISTEFQFAYFSEIQPTEVTRLRVEYDDILTITSTQLSPLEHQQAEALAKKLISENDSCCQRF